MWKYIPHPCPVPKTPCVSAAENLWTGLTLIHKAKILYILQMCTPWKTDVEMLKRLFNIFHQVIYILCKLRIGFDIIFDLFGRVQHRRVILAAEGLADVFE